MSPRPPSAYGSRDEKEQAEGGTLPLGHGSRAPGAATPAPRPLLVEVSLYWGAVAAWMVIISLLSSEPFSAANTHRYLDPALRFFFPDLTPAGFVFAHTVIRKTAHFVEFFVLGCLAFWASRRGRPPLWRAAWMFQALGIGVLYALVDEAHQAFVPNRSPSLADSGVDSLGAATSQALIYVRHLVRGRSARRSPPG